MWNKVGPNTRSTEGVGLDTEFKLFHSEATIPQRVAFISRERITNFINEL
jgi:hypothetical protein